MRFECVFHPGGRYKKNGNKCFLPEFQKKNRFFSVRAIVIFDFVIIIYKQ